jgi:hypothetical protein
LEIGNHMTATLAFIIILVLLALVFDYINGFHDASDRRRHLGNELWTKWNFAGDSNFRRARRTCRDCIVRTMGTRITKLKPVGGFCAESAAFGP